MLVDFKIENLASRISFYFAILISLEKDKKLDNNKLKISKNWQNNLDVFCKKLLKSN